MGRLTLNILLSFAQFERELIGERVRDKIAASKKKGMWTGGTVPLGYDVRDRKLEVNESEAGTVVEIFRRYLRLKSVRALAEELAAAGIRSKRRYRPNGTEYGNQRFSHGALYLMLQNRTYRAKQHKGATPFRVSIQRLLNSRCGTLCRRCSPRTASRGPKAPARNSLAC
jgi:site-specific DNA recombinase